MARDPRDRRRGRRREEPDDEEEAEDLADRVEGIERGQQAILRELQRLRPTAPTPSSSPSPSPDPRDAEIESLRQELEAARAAPPATPSAQAQPTQAETPGKKGPMSEMIQGAGNVLRALFGSRKPRQ